MQVKACLKNADCSAQKVRLVADQVRGLDAEQAEELLTFSTKKAAHLVKKVLLSAMANAEHNEGADIDELRIDEIYVDEGPTMKRGRARAKGQGTQILKRRSHITVIVGQTA